VTRLGLRRLRGLLGLGLSRRRFFHDRKTTASRRNLRVGLPLSLLNLWPPAADNLSD
jgi:hypothetical protein